MRASSRLTGEAGSSPLEDFLDELLVASASASPRQTRRLLSEAEAHLRDTVSEAVERGSSREEAERDAVRRFGPARDTARQDAAWQRLPFGALVRPSVCFGLLLSGLVGLAMGLSAIITGVMEAFGGSTFIVNISPHTYLAPADCARWLANDPSAHTCYNAALADWAGETVVNRAILGILGVLALATFLLLRWRWSARYLSSALPRNVVDAIMFTLFGAGGVWLTAVGLDAIADGSGRGAGQELGTAPVMIGLAVVFGIRLLQDLRSTAAETWRAAG